MELGEYIKALTPEKIRALIIENALLRKQLGALKTTIEVLAADSRAYENNLRETQKRCSELLAENRGYRQIGLKLGR